MTRFKAIVTEFKVTHTDDWFNGGKDELYAVLFVAKGANQAKGEYLGITKITPGLRQGESHSTREEFLFDCTDSEMSREAALIVHVWESDGKATYDEIKRRGTHSTPELLELPSSLPSSQGAWLQLLVKVVEKLARKIGADDYYGRDTAAFMPRAVAGGEAVSETLKVYGDFLDVGAYRVRVRIEAA